MDQKIINRTLSVPIGNLNQETKGKFYELRILCAEYANQFLLGIYNNRMTGKEQDNYTALNDKLGSYVRDSISHDECFGLWKRHGKEILRHKIQLPTFREDGVISVKDEGVRLEATGDHYQVRLTVFPATIKPNYLEIPLSTHTIKKSEWMEGCLTKMITGEYPIKKVVIGKKKKKWMAHLKYEKTVDLDSGPRVGTLGPLGTDRELYVGCEGKTTSLSQYVDLLIKLKERSQDAHDHIRRTLGRARKRKRYRKKLRSLFKFEEGKRFHLQKMGEEIVSFCVRERIGKLIWNFDGKISEAIHLGIGELKALVKQRAQNLGYSITIEEVAVADPLEPLSKTERILKQARVASRENKKLGKIMQKG